MHRKPTLMAIMVTVLGLSLFAVAMACTSEPPPAPTAPPPAAMMEEPKVDVDALKTEVVAHYANGVHGLYFQSLSSARIMDTAIDAFLADPNPASLEAAKRAWLRARDDYGPTEVFRFYGGPIDNEEDGPEGLINAWPMDESYIDYVEGNATAGIINMPDEYPTIDADLIISLNEEGGEENVSTGWHAIEFLLWGQDLNDDGPGDRPVEDYTTNDNADRRGQYLAVASDTLLGHLQDMVDAWAPGQQNYRAEFVAKPVDDALVDIITGAGALSQGELAGERINVAYEERSQEDEHSCFSDNTVADIVGNAIGVRMVLTGDYGVVSGPGIIDLFAAEDGALADRLTDETRVAVNMAHNIPDPFDQHLTGDAPDSAFGRTQVKSTIDALIKQAETIVAGAAAFGYQINTSV